MSAAKHILLVEDDAEVYDVLAFLLGREGYEVRAALSTDGFEELAGQYTN